MRIRSPFGPEEPFPGLASLIDVMFILLIFFMLTASFRKAEGEVRAQDVELPWAQDSRPLAQEGLVKIRITADGAIQVDSARVDPGQLTAWLRRYRREAAMNNSSADAALLVIEGATPFQAVQDVYDILQATGISQFSTQVRERP